MYPIKRAILFLTLVFSIVPVFAQEASSPDEAQKEKQRRNLELLENILNDARSLKLPENRAYISAKAGAVLCKLDPKRAGKLFESAAADLAAAQDEVENERQLSSRNYQRLQYGQSPRWPILFLIGGCNAPFALDAMARTRTPRLMRAIAESRMSEYSIARQFAAEESQNEQQLVSMAADQDPETAILALRESLKRGVNYQTLSLLQKIAAKNREAANQLAEEAVKRLIEADFKTDTQAAELTAQFLNEAAKEKQPSETSIRVSEALIRDMADKLVRFWLDKEVTSFNGQSSFAVVSKLFPDRAARVKQKFDETNKRNQAPQQDEYNRLLSSETPVEEQIAGASKLTGYMRNEVYRNAATRYANAGNIAQAEKLLMEKLPHEDAENYILQINMNAAYGFTNEGKVSEALAAIDRIPAVDQKIRLFINLGSSVFMRDRKDGGNLARSVLSRARELFPAEPETTEDISLSFLLAGAYADIDQEEAFSLAEPMVGVLNEIDQANATILRYQPYGNSRRGEFQIADGQSRLGVGGVDNFLQQMKEKDFERVVRFTAAFTRPETRISLQLMLLNENFNAPIRVYPQMRGFRFGVKE